MSGLFGEPKVDMSRGPVGTGDAPSGAAWSKDGMAPVSGTTPAARHASATGAMAASARIHGRSRSLLAHFASTPQVTLDAAREHLDIPINCVTGPWRRLEQLGWIEGTGTFETYTTSGGRVIRREYHRITAAGRDQAARVTRAK